MSMTLRDRRAYRADEKADHGIMNDEEKRRMIGVSL